MLQQAAADEPPVLLLLLLLAAGLSAPAAGSSHPWLPTSIKAAKSLLTAPSLLDKLLLLLLLLLGPHSWGCAKSRRSAFVVGLLPPPEAFLPY